MFICRDLKRSHQEREEGWRMEGENYSAVREQLGLGNKTIKGLYRDRFLININIKRSIYIDKRPDHQI